MRAWLGLTTHFSLFSLMRKTDVDSCLCFTSTLWVDCSDLNLLISQSLLLHFQVKYVLFSRRVLSVCYIVCLLLVKVKAKMPPTWHVKRYHSQQPVM